jgi:hypothetical protein
MTDSVNNRKFRTGVIIVLAYTAVFFLSDVSWVYAHEQGKILRALLSLAAMLLISCIPYTGLLRLLNRSPKFPRFQWIAFCMVAALPLIMLPVFKMAGGATGGWQYFLIPVWQLILYGLLLLTFKIIVAVDQRRSTRTP